MDNVDWLIDLAEQMSEEQRAALLEVLKDALEVLKDAEIGAGEATSSEILGWMETYRRAIANIAGA